VGGGAEGGGRGLRIRSGKGRTRQGVRRGWPRKAKCRGQGQGGQGERGAEGRVGWHGLVGACCVQASNWPRTCQGDTGETRDRETQRDGQEGESAAHTLRCSVWPMELRSGTHKGQEHAKKQRENTRAQTQEANNKKTNKQTKTRHEKVKNPLCVLYFFFFFFFKF
jgi:hypothetical protein